MKKFSFPMVAFLFKWFFLLMMHDPAACTFTSNSATAIASDGSHPFFVSVTELDYNQKEKSLEISCKMFSDDFENTLKTQYKTSIDITHPKDQKLLEKLVFDYLQKHLQLKINGKPVTLRFVGYEKENEAIWCYLQVNEIAGIKKLDVTNNLLYEMYNMQIGIMHASVGGSRKSTRLVYPDAQAVFEW